MALSPVKAIERLIKECRSYKAWTAFEVYIYNGAEVLKPCRLQISTSLSSIQGRDRLQYDQLDQD